MKRILTILPLLLVLTGCGTFGTTPSAPTANEQKFFNTITNYIAVVVPVTNTITLTNVVLSFQTNTVGQVVTVTNILTVPIPVITTVTNTMPVYTMTPNATTTGAASSIGSIANMIVPGGGGIVTLGITVLAGFWGWLRSYKGGQTSTALSQEIETVLEFVKALPDGAAYKKALTDFLAAHQNEAGVVTQVATILNNDISNPDAKVAAQQVINAINALQSATAVPAVPAVAPVRIGPVSLTTTVKP